MRQSPKARIGAGIKAIAASFAAGVAAQAGRWALWPPIALGAGAAHYFSAATEPPVWLGWAWLAGGGVLAAALAGAPSSRLLGPRLGLAFLCMLAAAYGAGLGVSRLRTIAAAAPRIEAPMRAAVVEGWVLDQDAGVRSPRIKLLVAGIEGVADAPRYLRLTTPEGAPPPGRAVRCRADLRPPEGPLTPGAFDFALRAYFTRIGGTGYVHGGCRPIALAPPADQGDRLRIKVAALRRDLTEEIYLAAPDEGGAIAAAMVTGDRSLIGPEMNAAFRDSGLGHMLSVSGLHMGLVAGAVFAALHAGLALWPYAALRAPIRKIAAGAAMLVCALYLIVSGASVPAIRSFVMTAVALGAVLLDRPAISLRGFAVAVLAILLAAPESVLDPGFQMSFAATAALVAAFESRPAPEPRAQNAGWLIDGLGGAWRIASATLLAGLVAGLATDPYAMFHFQRISVYGLVSNLAASPIVSFVVAPAAIVAAALAPFGLAEPALALMAGALRLVGEMGAAFAARPEALAYVPPAEPAALALATAGLVWACFWRGRWRLLCAAGFLAAGAHWQLTPKPVIWADGDLAAIVARTGTPAGDQVGRQAGDRIGDRIGGAGWIVVEAPRANGFVRSRLGGRAGLSPDRIAALGPPPGAAPEIAQWRTPGGRPAFRVFSPGAFGDACQEGALVFAAIEAPADFARRCRPALVADAKSLVAQGGLSVAETRTGLVVRRAGRMRARAWTGPLSRLAPADAEAAQP